MKYFLALLFSLALFACGPEAPEFGQTGQPLWASFVSNCTYKPSIKKLDGTVQSASGVTFPMKNLTLTLKDASLNVLDVVSIAPLQVWPTSSITQTVTTGYTTQIKKVDISGTDDTGLLIQQHCDVI